MWLNFMYECINIKQYLYISPNVYISPNFTYTLYTLTYLATIRCLDIVQNPIIHISEQEKWVN